ncbi:MAG: hypothetical protein A3G18_12675 [Rhodospirillales bacterium RIFCSPLOWO2_12_FULL_58_28]|nr:MAG: hypothetical protein A3H92_10080 [Rhodospirillales bacterium RIFCSPLOWO2_02_FULL_58_16]OHC77121.1 MAG: hypothetical protein A3G18_12675 [Rhodospirillales bacterium RIFCSPLOWO2_12_FULL_58_28]
MQVIETPGEGVVITDVALASLRTAVVQQEQFSKLLEEVAKRREEDLGQQQPKADHEQVKAGQPDKVEAAKKPVTASSPDSTPQTAVDDKRGSAVDIKA